jgi:hypothetical protein
MTAEPEEKTVDSVLQLEENSLSSAEIHNTLESIIGFNLAELLKLPKNKKFIELEFFQSNTESQATTLFSNLNKTSTIGGKLTLQSILVNPVESRSVLEHRAEILTSFNDSELLRDVRNSIDELGKVEGEYVWFLKSRTPEMNKVLEIVYFGSFWNQFLNGYNWFMKYYYYFIILVYPLYGMLAPIVFFILPYIAIYFLCGYWIPIEFYISMIKNLFFAGGNVFSTVSKVYSSMSGGGGISGIVSEVLSSGLVRYLYYGFIIAGYLYSIYSATIVSISYYKIIAFIHQKLAALAKFVRCVSSVSKLVPFDFGIKLELPEHFTELWNPIFDTGHQWHTDKGAVLSLYWKIKDQCSEVLAPWFKYLGLLDAWSSVATLELGTPEFIWESPKPSIVIEHFWNPMVAPDSRVVNSIKCGGGNQPLNIIITSPNASGKSTCMKAIIECLLLAQTIGRVPAKQCRLTPFKYIATYLNIPDTQGRESLFQAEMARCFQQIEELKQLRADSGEFAFTIMDEIFTSTNQEEGISGTYGIMRKLASFTNSINMITTHFDIIKKAFKKDNRFKNYHFPITISAGGEVIRTFKLEAGISAHPKIALELLKCKGFDDDLLADAQRMFNLITRRKKIKSEVKETKESKDTKESKTALKDDSKQSES